MSSSGHYGPPLNPDPSSDVGRTKSLNDIRDESVAAAEDGAIQQTAGDLVDTAARAVSKYVCTAVGDQVIADPDNEVKRILTEMLAAYEERKNVAALREALTHATGALKKLPPETFGMNDNGCAGPEREEWPIIDELIAQCELVLNPIKEIPTDAG